MEAKSLKERAEEARVQEEEKAQAKEAQRRSVAALEAISYFREHFPEAEYHAESGKFELEGEFFSFMENRIRYDFTDAENPKVITSYQLCPSGYNGYNGFANLADYGRYLKKKEETERSHAEMKSALNKMTRDIIAKGRPGWKKLLFNIDG